MIVEHSNLLVMAAPHGMRAVEAEADRARQSPAHDHRQDARHRELLEPAEIPAKDIDVAIGLVARESQQIVAERQIGRAHAELQSLMRISYAVFCLKKTTHNINYI